MSKLAEDDSVPPPLVGFVNTLPSPVVAVLIGLAPHISRIRHYIQVISWKSSSEESWIAVALWWTVCLLSEVALRYILPLAILVVLIISCSTTKPNLPPPPVSEDTLQRAVSDLSTIHALLPSSSLLPSPTTLPPLVTLLRTFAILYIPYLLLTHFIRLRILLAIAGTVLLTWRARWAILLRRSLWRSAFLRWSLYRAWSLLSGMPLPPRTFSPQTISAAAVAPPATSLRFLFTVYENQRWWMGLDWTAALLPGERPSWCTAAQQPVAPPTVFALPASTTAYMLADAPAESGKTGAGAGPARIKRTARWCWEEDEWRVVVRRDGTASARVERPLPSPKEEGAAASSANRILRAAGKMRQTSISSLSPERGKEREREEGDAGAAHAEQATGEAADAGAAEDAGEEEEPCTDADGWIYGDNKWEGGTSKGGMGKYTRYRRWTRIAVLTETAELVGPGELGVVRDEIPPAPPALPQEHAEAHELHEIASLHEDDDRARLRQRLKAVVRSATQG